MPTKTLLQKWTQQERLNFLLTNRIPRRWATIFMGRFSRIRHPWVRKGSMAIWKRFAGDLDLSEALKNDFESLHDCFIRQLKPGARPIDTNPDVLTSPCDAIVGACGDIQGTQVFQAKGFPYRLEDLLPDPALVEKYRDGRYVTLRLTSTMYHRFHAPTDCGLKAVTYISGDTWNVNPIALRRVEKLFCKNERAVLDLDLDDRVGGLALVPVAAILVASIKLHCLPETLSLRYQGPNHIPCTAHYCKGDEMGYFEHGSTIVLFCTKHFQLADGIREGLRIRMGQSLLVEAP